MVKRIIYILLLLFIMLDIGYSFMQHYNTPLDGDIAESIVPADHFKPLFESPLGFQAIKNQQTYPNPNRFFTHWSFKEYMINMPLLIQRFTDPINSVYLSCAIAKTIIQICLIIFLAIAICGTINMLTMDFIIAAALITPLFQTNGYSNYMGVIDPSITYTFSYALPCALLIFYFLPFIRHFYHEKKVRFHFIILLLWIPLGLIVSLSGPLNPGIVLAFSFIALLWSMKSIFIRSNDDSIKYRFVNTLRNIPKYFWFIVVPISFFSLYSLYLGQYNSHSSIYSAALSNLYLSIPKGIYYQFTQKLGFPVLFLVLGANVVIILRMFNTTESKKVLSVFKWIGLFSLLFILLLPLGGYRDYRPNVLRYDTIMPITLCLFFAFGTTSLFIIKNISKRKRLWYIPLLAFVLIIYSFADQPEFDKNNCEILALEKISQSPESIIRLNSSCSVLSWGTISKPEDSDLNAQMLIIWNITDRRILYYQ